MLAAIPAAKLACSQTDAIAESRKATAPTTEVQERVIQLLHSATAGSAWLFKGWLAIIERHDARKAGYCCECRQQFRLVFCK
jgi:hypothetical protein